MSPPRTLGGPGAPCAAPVHPARSRRTLRGPGAPCTGDPRRRVPPRRAECLPGAQSASPARRVRPAADPVVQPDAPPHRRTRRPGTVPRRCAHPARPGRTLRGPGALCAVPAHSARSRRTLRGPGAPCTGDPRRKVPPRRAECLPGAQSAPSAHPRGCAAGRVPPRRAECAPRRIRSSSPMPHPIGGPDARAPFRAGAEPAPDRYAPFTGRCGARRRPRWTMSR